MGSCQGWKALAYVSAGDDGSRTKSVAPASVTVAANDRARPLRVRFRRLDATWLTSSLATLTLTLLVGIRYSGRSFGSGINCIRDGTTVCQVAPPAREALSEQYAPASDVYRLVDETALQCRNSTTAND